MLVLVSDLHLTDERTARNVNPEAFKLFGAEVAATARKRGARETILVLLGDIIDLVRTDYWLRQRLAPDERPWGGKLDPKTGMNSDSKAIERQFLTILQDILGSPTAQQFIITLTELERTCPAFSVRYVGNQDGTVKMYINTGTYLPLITQAEDGESFASSIEMVYVYLYRVDEDLDTKQPGTTSMDIWTGIRRKLYG
jgi:hypothetical protein